MSNYFPELHSHFDGNIKVELDLSNYATKSTNATDTSIFAEKVDLISLKSHVDELDIEKWKTIPN